MRATGDPAPVKMVRTQHRGWLILNAPDRTLVSFDAVADPAFPVRMENQTITFVGSNRCLVYAIETVNTRNRYYDIRLLVEATEGTPGVTETEETVRPTND